MTDTLRQPFATEAEHLVLRSQVPIPFERRKNERVSCCIMVKDSTGKQETGKAINLSLGGFCIESPNNLQLGQRQLFQLELTPKYLFVNGEIVNGAGRTGKVKRYGIQFLDDARVMQNTLEPFVFERKIFEERYSFYSKRRLSSVGSVAQGLPGEVPATQRLLDRLEEIARGRRCDVSWMNDVKLAPEIVDLHSLYSEVGRRPLFLWQWAHAACSMTSLGSVADREVVATTKVAAIMLNVLLDDLADKFHEREVFEFCSRLLIGVAQIADWKGAPEWRRYFEVVLGVMNFIRERIQQFPFYETLKEILVFDFEQIFNCMRYALTANSLWQFANLAEFYMYQSHNMNMMINLTIDLMNHRTFDLTELGRIRQIVLEAQKLVRIGNMISTWERELEDGDFSNAVFAYALEKRIISPDQLNKGEWKEIRAAIRGTECEKPFLKDWLVGYDQLIQLYCESDIRSVDISPLVENMPRLLISMHLGSRDHI